MEHRDREMYSSQRDIEMKAPLRRGREVYGQKGSYCTAERQRHRPGQARGMTEET